MLTSPRRLIALLCSAILLIVVACGNNGDVAGSAPTDAEDTTTSDTTPTTAAPTTTTTEPPPPLGLPEWPENPGPTWPSAGQAALTFDDGPDPDYTRPILDVLAEYEVPATFFVVGRSTVTWPELVAAMADEGHSVGNHTWSHPNLTFLPDGEVASQISRTTDAIIEALGGRAPLCFRAPEGARDARVDSLISAQGLHHVLWNINPDDYLQRPAEEMVATTLEQVAAQDGAGVIIGLHDGGGPREQTVAAVPGIIEGVEAMGYEWVRLC
ncbi:MAG: polysaccharide deacetylase family protein [Acidimicrobiia bacterium]|nr:polysaccharide deacetylase family protein [Acidimicrobiia bacterium]